MLRLEFEATEAFLAKEGRTRWVYLSFEADDGGNLLRRPYLEALIRVRDEMLEGVAVEAAGANYTYFDLCGSKCDEIRPSTLFLNLYALNSTRLEYTYPVVRPPSASSHPWDPGNMGGFLDANVGGRAPQGVLPRLQLQGDADGRGGDARLLRPPRPLPPAHRQRGPGGGGGWDRSVERGTGRVLS